MQLKQHFNGYMNYRMINTLGTQSSWGSQVANTSRGSMQTLDNGFLWERRMGTGQGRGLKGTTTSSQRFSFLTKESDVKNLNKAHFLTKSIAKRKNPGGRTQPWRLQVYLSAQDMLGYHCKQKPSDFSTASQGCDSGWPQKAWELGLESWFIG